MLKQTIFSLLYMINQIELNLCIISNFELFYPFLTKNQIETFYVNWYMTSKLLWINYNFTKPSTFYNLDWLILVDFFDFSAELFIPTLYFFFLKTSLSVFDVMLPLIEWLLISVCYLISFIYFQKIILTKVFEHYTFSFPEYFYFEYEHNIGDGECLYMLFSFFLAILFLNLIYLFTTCVFLDFYIVSGLLILVFILIPIRIVWAFGSNFIMYIKGSTNYKMFSIAIFNDALTISAVLLRFSIQAVRIIIVYLFYFFFHEYIFVWPKNYLTELSNLDSMHSFKWVYYNVILLRWLLELLDSTVSICNQLASFFFVIFWLFSYINTCELKKEKLFHFSTIKLIIRIDPTETH